ncbi:MAG: general secretion pathway protein GspK [Opitutaceae bacterium]|nr:general secretion pathway protein GspK [Opitutaceae bacterium]
MLGLVLLTALLLTQFISRAHTDLLTEARRSQLEPLRDEAYTVLQVSLAVLRDCAAVDEGLHAPAQGWGDPLTYSGYIPPPEYTVRVEILDESGKLPLAARSAAALLGLLRELNVSATDTDRFVDALLAWTEAEAAARTIDGLVAATDGTPALAAPQAALRSFEELRFIPATRAVLCDEQGDWNETGRAFLANVTLHPLGAINVNTASDVLLTALGLNPTAVNPARQNRPGSPESVLRSMDGIGPAADAGITVGTDATVLRIRITATQGARRFTLEVVAQPGGDTALAPVPTDLAAGESEPRPWTRNSIDSGFRILEVQENNGY